MGVPAVHLSPPALAALHLMYGHESEKLEQMISAHSRAKMMADQEREVPGFLFRAALMRKIRRQDDGGRSANFFA